MKFVILDIYVSKKINFAEEKSDDMLENIFIEIEGKMSSINLDKLQNAFKRFLTAYTVYKEDTEMSVLEHELMQEALVHRFEYCTEVFWKILRRYLELAEGLSVQPSPKNIIRHAGSLGILDPVKWIAFINARQLVSHDYDQEKLDSVLVYMEDFAKCGQELLSYLEENNNVEH